LSDAHPAGECGPLEVRIARKTFARTPGGRLEVLRDIAFTLPRGEVAAFVGQASEANLAALFETLELAPHRWHYPGQLSLGLARRAALARAFAVEASLLILDEPFVSLDDALATRLRGELVKLIDSRPVTTLLVTHDVEEAIGLADRLFLLSAGPARIVAELPIGPRDAASTAAIRAEVVRLSCAR
jgi:NitT/TauT family transport system ATP-binding protein